jgi:hypothetical protein
MKESQFITIVVVLNDGSSTTVKGKNCSYEWLENGTLKIWKNFDGESETHFFLRENVKSVTHRTAKRA